MSVQPEQSEQWATVDLMGHAQTAGRISMENSLLRVDVPEGDTYRTNYYGLAAIYHIEIVSEQIARAYGRPSHAVVAYDTPIVTREQHVSVVSRLENEQIRLRDQVRQLERRLTAVNALPAPTPPSVDTEDDDEEE